MIYFESENRYIFSILLIIFYSKTKLELRRLKICSVPFEKIVDCPVSPKHIAFFCNCHTLATKGTIIFI